MDAMTDEPWPDGQELREQLRAQLALEGRFPGWQILHAPRKRWVRYAEVPEDCFYAVHDRLSEPPLVATDLDQLAGLVEQRQQRIQAVARWVVRSDLRRIEPWRRS
ncbi:hypothetical protein [Actinoplanes regularis]|uniref:hypothetical protein n=1 Tax=Actinoplanes regularis TaxID=52697 RepID=UPI0024A52AD9|nr:hypothetical protein [Actinoplanes regularis]GLW32221.1 hypothetical protein Areg01_51600 [Actinoplanes regularis]